MSGPDRPVQKATGWSLISVASRGQARQRAQPLGKGTDTTVGYGRRSSPEGAPVESKQHPQVCQRASCQVERGDSPVWLSHRGREEPTPPLTSFAQLGRYPTRCPICPEGRLSTPRPQPSHAGHPQGSPRLWLTGQPQCGPCFQFRSPVSPPQGQGHHPSPGSAVRPEPVLMGRALSASHPKDRCPSGKGHLLPA